MAQLDIHRILSYSIIMIEYSGEKTIGARTIQAAFKMCYYDDAEKSKQGVKKGTINTTLFSSYENNAQLQEFKNKINYNEVEKIIRDFLHNVNENRNDKIRLSCGAIPYLAGLIEVFD